MYSGRIFDAGSKPVRRLLDFIYDTTFCNVSKTSLRRIHHGIRRVFARYRDETEAKVNRSSIWTQDRRNFFSGSG